jgi:hypothetical protein
MLDEIRIDKNLNNESEKTKLDLARQYLKLHRESYVLSTDGEWIPRSPSVVHEVIEKKLWEIQTRIINFDYEIQITKQAINGKIEGSKLYELIRTSIEGTPRISPRVCEEIFCEESGKTERS